MKPFYIYKQNSNISYSAEQIYETESSIFLVESNITVGFNDIIKVSDVKYTIKTTSFFVLVVIDKKIKDIIVNYGRFGYCHSLYYYQDTNSLYINLSLKKLLKDINIVPKLNTKKVTEFVRFGFIQGNECLVKGIKKIEVTKIFSYKNDKIELQDRIDTYITSTKDYVESLKTNLPSAETKIILPLSGGFDSTLLAYLLLDHKDKLAISVGTNFDRRSELERSILTAKSLNLKQEIVETTFNWIAYLPQLVDIMEGEMFEMGLFLCYAIVERIKELNLMDYTIVSGDGADQLLNVNFYTEDVNKLPNASRHTEYFLKDYPKYFFYSFIIKKLEWLLRENDIKYLIPFISEDFINCAKNIKTENKEEYKIFVKDYLPQDISKHLIKYGGMINGKYFIAKSTKRKLIEVVNSPKYSDLFTNDNRLEVVIYKLYIILFKYIYIDGNSIDMSFNKLLDRLI